MTIIRKYLYSLIYINSQGDCIYSVVLANGYFNAQDIASEDVKQWEGFRVYSTSYLDRGKLEAGEVVFVGA